MKQGIIFGLLVTILSFFCIHQLATPVQTTGLNVIILQNGEEVYSTPLLYDNEESVIWYVHEKDEIKILVDQEIIDYYGFDMTVEELKDPSNIDYNAIYATSGKDTEINMIVNGKGRVQVYEANCPDKIDVKMGAISDTSKVITCAPHKLVIKLRGTDPNSSGEELDG